MFITEVSFSIKQDEIIHIEVAPSKRCSDLLKGLVGDSKRVTVVPEMVRWQGRRLRLQRL